MALDLFDSTHSILKEAAASTQAEFPLKKEDNNLSIGYAHHFSLIYGIDGFTDEEVRNMLTLEAKKKYR
ncbi:MAG: hypothetical protein LUI85_04935 [Bacteroides sp.]|nr:hypothetical protein [Bacteroides sp.]